MRASFLPLYALTSLAVACTAPAMGPGSGADGIVGDAAEGASSAALVVFERTVTADDSAHSNAVARFIKVRAGSLDDQTLRMVGATLDLPALGTCAAAGASPSETLSADGVTAASHEGDGPRAVELLDVGAIGVDANGIHTTLEARALPDIVDLVTGVLYSTRTTAFDSEGHPEGLPARGSYVLRSTGSSVTADAEHNVPPFSVSATAPGEPDELRIDGQDARSSDGVTLSTGSKVDLAWGVGDTSDPDDVVYVEIIASRSSVDGTGAQVESVEPGESAANVRCLFSDHGAASIPASAFSTDVASVASLASGRTQMTRGTMVVHRVHRETFTVTGTVAGQAGQMGIDSGIVRFDFARATEFTRR